MKREKMTSDEKIRRARIALEDMLRLTRRTFTTYPPFINARFAARRAVENTEASLPQLRSALEDMLRQTNGFTSISPEFPDKWEAADKVLKETE